MKLPDNSDMDLKEQKDHGTASFPCGLYEIFEVTDWEGVKHHWHDEVEILYFMKGDFQLDVNMETYHIQEECFYFINAGICIPSIQSPPAWNLPCSFTLAF
ncbi:AraC family ligand binding domain-containing protein [Blautia sp. RD014234]|nr:AraC family ligand binding domain-containing protein [Blautia parvula]